MNQSNLLTLSLVLVVTASGALAAPANGDNSIKELYDYLLQREYAEPLSLDHQMERKAVRSPSMRLRFGRRSDPDIPLIGRDNQIDNEVDQKPIRSPSMRLRFGRRDPMMPLFNEENMLYGNEPLTRKSQRTPSVRLRFGKRDPSSLLENEMGPYHLDDSASPNHAEE